MKVLPRKIVKGKAEDLENLRLIRNECREYMTHHTAEIGAKEQVQWWKTLDHSSYRIFLYDLDLEEYNYLHVPVGYGLIRVIEGCAWLTGGLRRVFRGLGLGRQIFTHLISECEPSLDVWLEVRQSNYAAYKLYTSLGFVPIKEEIPGVVDMKLKDRRQESA